MNRTITLENRIIGPGEPPFIIAEIAQAHDGSLGMAHAFIDTAADVGVDAIKFQTHIAEAESTLDEPFRAKFSKQDETRFDYWKRMEFTASQWANLASHAHDRGLLFLSSPFSIEAVNLLNEIGMPAWKIGSGEIENQPLITAMQCTGKPFLVSTGMSTYSEISAVCNRLEATGNQYALFQCTSQYPVALEKVGLNVIDKLRERFGCPVGLSDHSGTLFPALAAMAMGADLIEVHLTFHKQMFGPDTAASIDCSQLDFLIQCRDAFNKMNQHPIDKDQVACELDTTRRIFARSLALCNDLLAGTIIKPSMLTLKKPGTGIPYEDMDRICGKRLRANTPANRLLTKDDLTG